MAFKLVGSWSPHKSNQVGLRLRAMSSCATLLEMLSAERLFRCEKYLDVPDRDGSKPFVFSIDGKNLQASNRIGAHWKKILSTTEKYISEGDLTEQFAIFKIWLESDWRKRATVCSNRSQDQPPVKKLRFLSSCATLLEMLSAERLFRCERHLDVPDRDGSKPFVFSIDGKDLQASNRKGADWNRILSMTKTYVSKGNLTQQFAALKEWLESAPVRSKHP